MVTHIIYLLSASYVSAGKFGRLAAKLEAAAPAPAKAIRLEGRGEGLWAALDGARTSGATRIELRPVGLPFSQSLERWLPRAAGAWLARQADPHAITIEFAMAPQEDLSVVETAARAKVPLRRVEPTPGGHRGKGWDAPPAFRHHILVCTGPRCHLHDAPSLIDALKQELAAAGLSQDCLVTSTGCLFPCNKGPVLVHYPAGHWYRVADLGDVRRFVTQAIARGMPIKDLIHHQSGDTYELA